MASVTPNQGEVLLAPQVPLFFKVVTGRYAIQSWTDWLNGICRGAIEEFSVKRCMIYLAILVSAVWLVGPTDTDDTDDPGACGAVS